MAADLTKYRRDVDKIREALKEWLDIGISVFLLLREVETAGNWKEGGHSTFGEFLSAEFPNTLGTHRYQSVINAVGVYGENLVRLVGPEGAHALCHPKILENETKRKAVIADIDENVRVNGVAPGPNELVRLVRHHAGDVQNSNAADRANKLRQETSEVNALRIELRDLNVKLCATEKKLKEQEARATKAEKERDESKRRCVQLSREVTALKRKR